MIIEEHLWREYIEEQRSLRQVAEVFGVSTGTIRYYMKKYGVPLRSKSESLLGDKNPMYGRPKTEVARKKTSETLKSTNADPAVRARRSAATTGARNPMAGRTHTQSSRQAMSQKQKARCSSSEVRAQLAQQARDEWAQPEVRRVLTEHAKQRTGNRNPFFGRTHTPSTVEALSKANTGRFRGANGSNWQGGRTKLALLVRNAEASLRWRQQVMQRDKFTCQACGRVGGPLQADHIKPFASILSDNNITTLDQALACAKLWDLTNGRTLCKPSNGRTLCKPCHEGTPSFAGKYQRNYKPRKR